MISSALVPIFAIILLGFLLSRLPISTPSVWSELEKLVYYIFFPALLVLRLSDSNFAWIELADIAKVIGLALFVMTLFIVALSKFIAVDMGSLSSVYQGSIRFNTYIGLAIIEALYGSGGLANAALCIAVYIPLVNVLSVIALSLQGEKGARRWFLVLGSVVSNPLVLACVAGIVISVTDLSLPGLAVDVLDILSQPALPLGLLAVGAGIRFISLGEQTWQLLIATFNKLLAFPALVLATCLLWQSPASLAMTLLLLSCLPAPPSSYILARQLGGNVTLMANIITLQTLGAFFMIPVWIELGGRFL